MPFDKKNPRYELLEQQLGPLDPLDPLDLDPLQGGLSISSNVEAEYDQLMKETRQELSVMRQPSAEDVAQKQRNAQQLKLQIETWAALVETRIHLEAGFGWQPVLGGKGEMLFEASWFFFIGRLSDV